MPGKNLLITGYIKNFLYKGSGVYKRFQNFIEKFRLRSKCRVHIAWVSAETTLEAEKILHRSRQFSSGIVQDHGGILGTEVWIYRSSAVRAWQVTNLRKLVEDHLFVYALLQTRQWMYCQKKIRQIMVEQWCADFKQVPVNTWGMKGSSGCKVGIAPTICYI